MSYSRKTLGFMTTPGKRSILEQIVAAGLLRGFDDLLDVLGEGLGHDEDGVLRRDDHEILDAHDAHERCALVGDDEAALAVDQRHAAEHDVALRVGGANVGDGGPAADVTPAEGA